MKLFNALLNINVNLTSLFPQDMIQDICILHWNILLRSIGVAWNVGPYKLSGKDEVVDSNLKMYYTILMKSFVLWEVNAANILTNGSSSVKLSQNLGRAISINVVIVVICSWMEKKINTWRKQLSDWSVSRLNPAPWQNCKTVESMWPLWKCFSDQLE